MRRRSIASSKLAKARSRKAMPKRRNATTVRAESESTRLRRERDEALERETATSQVLRLISKSPGDLELVFRSILESWAEGRPERFAEIAAEFVRLKVDVIVTLGGAVLAAKQATSIIPIVFAAASDPVGSGLVASLERPGGNITGLSIQAPDIAGKRLELLHEVVRGLRRLAILVNVDYSAAVQEMGEARAAAGKLGLEVTTLEIRRAEDIAPAFETLTGRAEALYVTAEPLLNAYRIRIITLANIARLPMISAFREIVESGGLMGPDNRDLFRRAGDDVDKILRGAKPGDIPVEQPTKFDLAPTSVNPDDSEEKSYT